jgi:hypothetical protein
MTIIYKVKPLDPTALTLLTVEVENIGSPSEEVVMRLSIPAFRESNTLSQTLLLGWQDSGNTTLAQFRDYLTAIDPTLTVVAAGQTVA